MLHTSLSFTWMFVLSVFLKYEYENARLALKPLQGRLNIRCCKLVMLCVKSAKDEKQIREKIDSRG